MPWVAAFALCLFGVSLLGASATSNQGNPFMFPQLEIEWLIAVLLMLPAIFTRGGGGLIRRILADSRLAFVGVISYGIYLRHFPLIAWADGSRAHLPHGGWMLDLPHRVPGPVTLWLLVAGLGLGGVAGAISYYAVELPFLRMKDRPARDPAPARAAPELREASPEAA